MQGKIRLNTTGILLTLALVLLYGPGRTQNSLAGVYAGVKVSTKPGFGGGMTLARKNIVLYLRPDGTLTDDLKRADWKTAVTGNYKQVGDKINVTSTKNSRVTSYSLHNGNLKSGSTILQKLAEDGKVPEGAYKFTYASTSGGGVAGNPTIGMTGRKSFYFDGKGKFSREGKGTVSLSGGNVGGGTTRNDPSESGTYFLNDGVLTLTFANGKTQKHSFFVGRKAGSMAVIDGQPFFKEKEKP